MRRTLKIIAWLVVAVVVYVAGILLYGTVTDWQPKGIVALNPQQAPATAPRVITDSLLTLTTWNVGYGGLGAEEYFYYNRGDFFWTDLGRARASRAHVDAYVEGQQLTLQSTRTDFFLLQEVDTASRRSYYTNQLASARKTLPAFAAYYAPNFQTKHVPLPIFQPWDHYGTVQSGLLTLSRFVPVEAERLQLPGEFPWPTKLFQLDRCALRQVFRTAWGKELVIYNVHLSAYDADGSVRRQQMSYLRERALEDQAAGRYVIIGGDWNQLPPGYNWFTLNPTVEETQLPPGISYDFMPPGWSWAYDPTGATVRKSDAAYDRHRSERSLIDFYLTSPDIRLQQLKTIEQDFRYSDHQPVYLEAELLR
ncbi:hypothetical protein LEM8419_01430 [Neolewinella maritima]|uniref:Endonuclease/exonuclease/phosphatase domain-containing protein n=1 Tax=Neolewinella maritima TaxID=1383882 RepID=A0ABM9AZZ8_9BACT|nr:endonuclease/exonuclease/phosphatase family protein [Neolewinella maritima]CAH1000279.1 hypothetical protein LEM8419_01430 [Neolewinella maritima]